MREAALSGQSVSLITGTATALVGIVAILFAWWNTRATLAQQRTMAFDDRKWQEQRTAYQKIAEWLAANHLLGKDQPFYQHDPFDPWTSDPGMELEATARLFAANPVITALTELHSKAVLENNLAHAAQLIASAASTRGTKFPDHEIAKTYGWKNPGDASRRLTELRDAWDVARTDLEKALRDVYRPL